MYLELIVRSYLSISMFVICGLTVCIDTIGKDIGLAIHFVIGKPQTRANMRDVINLVRIIINGFSDTCTEVELFDLIFLSKTLQSYDNIMKLQTKGEKKTN